MSLWLEFLDDLEKHMPVLSLIVALLAVIVGPFVSWINTKLQIKYSTELANKQILSPIRQDWINSLRKKLSEFLMLSRWYEDNGTYDHVGHAQDPYYRVLSGEDYAKADRRLTLLITEIELMINPHEDNHNQLMKCLSDCRDSALDRATSEEFSSVYESTSDMCKAILKDEWGKIEKGE